MLFNFSEPLLRTLFNMVRILTSLHNPIIGKVSINLQIYCFKFFQRKLSDERKKIEKIFGSDRFEVLSFNYSR